MADAPNIKTNWQWGDIVLPDDMNRIEQNIQSVYEHNLTTATANYAVNASNTYALGGYPADAYARLGESNADVNLWKAMAVEIDTRTASLNYAVDGKLASVVEKDPVDGTVYRTYTLVYDTDGTLSAITEAIQNATITYTLLWDNGNLIGVRKEVE